MMDKEFKELMKMLLSLSDEIERHIEEDERCEYYDSLMEDYNEFLEWCFGMDVDDIPQEFTLKDAIEAWKRNHPTLPVPRVMKTIKYLSLSQRTMGLVIFDFK